MHYPSLLFLLVSTLAPAVHSQPRPCDIHPAPGCTCWQQFSDITVSCNSLGLQSLPALSQTNSVLTRLDKLELAFNNLTTLDFVDFHVVTARHLDISHNKLSSIEVGPIRDIRFELESLDLSYNRLDSLPSLRRFSVLNSLDVSHNHLTTALYEILSTLPASIRHLQVTYNPIESTYVPRNSRLNTLSSFSLGPVPNRIYLDGLFGKPSRNLRRVRLVGSKLHLRQGDSSALRALNKLEELDIENCSVSYITPPDFRFVLEAVADHLRVLTLTHNVIDSIEGLRLHAFRRLTTLNLSHNQLTSIDAADVRNLDGLRYLYLQHNRIATVAATAFKAMKKLRFLDLSHNQLRRLPQSAFTRAHMLSLTALLSGNPWRCDCALRWLIEATRGELEGQPGPLQAYELHNALECDAPGEYAGVSFLRLATELYPGYTALCQ